MYIATSISQCNKLNNYIAIMYTVLKIGSSNAPREKSSISYTLSLSIPLKSAGNTFKECRQGRIQDCLKGGGQNQKWI